MNERIKKSKVTRFFELDILGLLLNLDEQFKINIWTMFSIPVTRDLLSLSVAIALCYYNSQSPMLHHNPLRVRRAEFWDLRSAAYLRKLEVGACGNMKRVNSCVKSDEHVLEELETEGERQLKSLLQHQLDTSVSIEECMSKKESFAPGTMYKPFGKEAAGTMTLSQFQTLHEKDQETASLRELGLNETEILIWKSHVSGEKTRLRATPEAIQNRLQDIEERISERQRILCLPQRFAKSKQLTRREMEIEKSLFQGADRHSFLKALYYQAYHKKTSADKYMTSMKRKIKLGTKDEPQKKNKGDPMNNLESFYQEMIMKKRLEEFQLMRGEPFASHSLVSATSVGDRVTAESPSLLQDKGKQAAQGKGPSLHVANVIDFSPEQCWTGPKKLTQPIEFVPEDEIQRNRLSEEEIRKIPMFSSYNPGEPNKVLYLKNLSPRVTERDLVSLFARFQEKKGPPIQFRMMTGRMRGQAFVTFPNKEIAWQALHLVNGYKLRGKILVIEFGKNKKQRSNLQATSLISCATGQQKSSVRNIHRPGTVAHASNPNTLGGQGGRIT
uniref:RNA-binding protein 41 isoform X2 n=1 Tax=Macaca mulatta TaxID=9544 RepID=UPI0010A242E1|nr:RNA-binding protein 41 isoform X2 [Macaca mulatta]